MVRRWAGGARLRALTLTVSALALLIAAGSAEATVPGSNGLIYFQGGSGIASANPDGSGQQDVADLGPDGVPGNLSVSPDGSELAWEGQDGSQRGMFETSTATGQTTELSALCDGDPSFSPDGTEIAFSRTAGQPGSTEGCGIASAANGLYVMNLATDATTMIVPGDISDVDWAPKGNKIAFVSTVQNGGVFQDSLEVANTDGTDVTTLENGYANGVSFSPDGSRVTYGANDGNVHVVNVDGTGDYVVTAGQYPIWSPDGTTIAYAGPVSSDGYHHLSFIHPDGTCPASIGVTIGEFRAAWAAGNSPMPPCGTPDMTAQAREFEPVLRFDSSEKWRPLNVDDFLAEGDNLICDSQATPQCDPTPIHSAADLLRHDTTTSYIKVYPGDFQNAGDEAQYHSPYAECTVNGLRDCDVGPLSAIYWGVNDPSKASGYSYIDYWFFYRANYFYGKIDWHEGDWEGITVAPSTTGQTFDYAAFSQHGTFWNYLPSVLRCEDTPASSIPARGTCMSGGQTTGHRIDVMVANGDHANYTTPCSEQFVLLSCRQNGAGHFERGYDGQARWGNAFADPSTTLLPLPPSGVGNWTDWPGRWGQPKPSSILDFAEGGGPASPGDQGFPFQCAWLDDGPGCKTRPARGGTLGPPVSNNGGGGGVIVSAADPGSGAVASAARASSGGAPSSPGLSALSCASWAGPGVGVAVCDPAVLRAAIRAGRLSGPGSLSIHLAGDRSPSAATRGITQFASGQPLTSGARLRLSGFLTVGDQLFVRTLDAKHKHVLLVGFRILSHGALAAGARTSTLELSIGTNRGGRPTASLGGQSASSVQTLS